MNNVEYKIASNKKDFEGLKKISKEIFDQEIFELADDLFYKSPKRDENMYFCAYDHDKERYVGILCLLETPVKYGNINLKTAEYAIAGTIEEYRGQGINTKLTEMFLEKAQENKYDLLVIEGIPYFYRRYGFNYSVEMTSEKIDLSNVELSYNDQLNIREAERKDIDFLTKSYNKTVNIYDLCKVKDKKIISAQLLDYVSDAVKKEYYIIENEGNKIGYFVMNPGDNAYICDMSNDLSFGQYESVLKYFKNNGYNIVITNLKENHKYLKYIKSIGSKGGRWYSYQLKIIDEFRFLNKIKSVLEERLCDTIYAEEEIKINYDNYREIIQIRINNGEVNLKKMNRDAVNSNFALIPQGAVKLFLGEKNMKDISDFLPDCYVEDKYRDLINLLFPILKSHFYVNY